MMFNSGPIQSKIGDSCFCFFREYNDKEYYFQNEWWVMSNPVIQSTRAECLYSMTEGSSSSPVIGLAQGERQ